jgi:hypothetical protein
MRSHLRTPLLLATGLFLAAGLLLLPTPGAADVVRLKTGDAVKGEPIVEASNEKVLVIDDFVTGARRSLVWDVVNRADRDRLWEKWGWESKTVRVVPGHRVRQRLADDSVEDILGLVLKNDASGCVVLVGGREMKIPAAQVVEVLEEDMDPRDIWTSEQLYERARKDLESEGTDLDALTSRDHWRLAEVASWAGYLEKSREHYEACANDDGFLRAPIAAQRLAEVESLLRDQAALDKLRAIRMSISLKAFGNARERLASFEVEHAEASDAVKRRFEETKQLFEEKRLDFLRDTARAWFVRELKTQIKAKVREKDIELADVSGWMKRELPTEAFDRLARRMQKNDPDVTVDIATTAWTDRKKLTWWSATFGSGTFIVFKPVVTPPKNNNKGNNNRSSSKGGAAPKVEIPKPPTRDQWWARADTGERENWVLAKFAMDSGLFEVSDSQVKTICPTCTGTGLESKANTNGTVLQYLCTRCAGAQNDIRIKFR